MLQPIMMKTFKNSPVLVEYGNASLLTPSGLPEHTRPVWLNRITVPPISQSTAARIMTASRIETSHRNRWALNARTRIARIDERIPIMAKANAD